MGDEGVQTPGTTILCNDERLKPKLFTGILIMSFPPWLITWVIFFLQESQVST